MKLLVDTKARRVLFAEAGKDVVDFLFSLLALPIGTAVKLIGAKSMVGSAGDLYRSVEKLDGTYVQPGAAKDAILRPVMARSPANSALLGLPTPSNRFFRCSSFSGCRDYVTDVSGTKCPRCSCAMTIQIQYAPPAGAIAQNAATAVAAADGFVRGVVTYTVMDSLAVSPMSAISSIALLNTFAVRDLTALQEKIVHIGISLLLFSCTALLKQILTSKFLKSIPYTHQS
ncbi:hypothetical protein CFC21_053644 [Triticum aestivum]|uniref:DUF674 domain-containing protein n=3 Tax=Triticum TaxID=4564 RepID=A0A9R0W3T2_TRITD|nr:hypothetical protein CFC21_053644 [Triticum aestivum]VAH95684.1 unnamed protein product [Triticum turgidum subsp. durum]